MKKLLYIVLFAIVFVMSSCTANKGFVSDLKSSDLHDIQQFKPNCNIGIIGKQNKFRSNDSLSDIAEVFVDERIARGCVLPITGKIQIDDSITEKRIENEIYYLMYWATNVRPSKLNEIKITYAIDSILESKGERFGLLLLTTGFTREKSNYAGQIAKGIGIGLLTLGSVYTVPYKEASQLYIMVVDAVDDNIAYFKSSILQEHSPIEFDTYNQHFYQLFKNYK